MHVELCRIEFSELIMVKGSFLEQALVLYIGWKWSRMGWRNLECYAELDYSVVVWTGIERSLGASGLVQ